MKTATASIFALLTASAIATPIVVRDDGNWDRNSDNRDHNNDDWDRDHHHCQVNGTLPASTADWTEADLYVPVSKKNPDVQFGSTTTPYVTPGDICTVFHHIIPVAEKGRFCTLKWFLPTARNAPNPYEFVGAGNFDFVGFTYDPNVTVATTYSTLPPLGPPIPAQVFKMGNTYTIDGGPCGIQNGQTQPSTIGGMLCSKDTTLGILASKEECPIGPFIIFSDTPGYP